MKKFFLSLALLCSMPFAALGETLITATDLHYLAPSLTDHGAFFNQLRTATAKPWLTATN